VPDCCGSSNRDAALMGTTRSPEQMTADPILYLHALMA